MLRERFDAAATRRLLAIAWWDRPVEWITRHLDLIRAADVDALEAAARWAARQEKTPHARDGVRGFVVQPANT